MRRATLTAMGLAVFGLVGLSFVVRGFGQLLVGPRTALLVAGPVAVAAGLLLALVLAIAALARVGVIALEDG